MTISASTRAEAMRLVRRGHSVNDAAKRTGVNRKTLARWLEAERESAPDSAPPPQPETPAPSLDEDGDILAIARQIIHEQKATAELARSDGNTTAAARALKSAGDAANLVARIESRRKADHDAVVIPRAELEKADRDLAEMAAALDADIERCGGLVCASCGRAIRMNLARGE